MRWRTGHNYGMSDDDDTFFPETNTVRTGEESATVTAGGDGIALQPGPWGEEHLHWTLPILMGVVGLSRSDLATAASSPLQPPSVGQDRERDQPAHTEHDHPVNDTTHALEDTSTLNSDSGLLGTILPAEIFGQDLGKLPIAMGEGEIVGPVSQTIAASVSMGEEEIVGTDVRRRLDQPLYTGHCTDVMWRLQLGS
jgi:hypothetical protein